LEQLDLPGFVAAANRFRDKIAALKQRHSLEQFDWYPYESLTAVSILERLLEKDFHLLAPLLASEPVLDVGCADGDLAFFLESLGATVDAIDYAEMNYNQLHGARRLAGLLHSSVSIHSVNLDWYFELPRARYGLVLFLGTLYHLKNPFYVLEFLARRGAYCILSTRVAQLTGRGGARIAAEPVAYLLDPRQTNDDSTNYWIFSEAGLLRLVERTGWSVVQQVHAGCLEDSNPVEAEADERMFLLLVSRQRYPDMQIRLLEGWHAPEESRCRWTAKQFSFEVLLPRIRTVKEFALVIAIPDEVIAAGEPVELTCEVNGAPAGSCRYSSAGSHTFRGRFPDPGARRAVIQFRVRHRFRPPGADRRDLGVVVSFADELAGARSGLPFRIS